MYTVNLDSVHSHLPVESILRKFFQPRWWKALAVLQSSIHLHTWWACVLLLCWYQQPSFGRR